MENVIKIEYIRFTQEVTSFTENQKEYGQTTSHLILENRLPLFCSYTLEQVSIQKSPGKPQTIWFKKIDCPYFPKYWITQKWGGTLHESATCYTSLLTALH